MGERAPYSRVYWAIVDDPKFTAVYDDNDLLASWLRLLITADALWPASAQIPRNIRGRALGALVDAGLIDVSGSRFRVHGLDAERGRRRDAARTPTVRVPNGPQTVAERDWGPGTKTRRDETRRANAPGTRPNTVDRDPHLSELRDAIRAKERDDA